MRKYMILEGRLPTADTLKRSAPPIGFGGVHPDIKPGNIRVENLTEKEAADQARNEQVAAIAPTMPISLIKPVEIDGPAAANTAWGISAVEADQSPFDGTGVKVAVLDTGIDASHSAFAHTTITPRDFTGSGGGDRNGHGTHCAGTIFGRGSNERIGVAPGVTDVLIGKVLGDGGDGSSEMIFSALQWAMEQRANIISMSLGFDFPGMVDQYVEAGWPASLATSIALEAYRGNLRMFDALMAQSRALSAFGAAPLIVAASGNESQRKIDPQFKIAASLPAAAEGVISVAALQQEAQGYSVADFSNSMATLAAPGHSILSAKTGGDYVALSGTSMACPHVAGVAALWWQKLGARASAAQVAAQLRASCRLDSLSLSPNADDVGQGLVTAPRS